MATDSLALDLRHVAKIYRKRVHALQDIDLHVSRGEVFGLLGPNGAGKSTLIKIIMTVVRPTRAEGTILSQPIGHKPTLARVGYLPENHRFPRYLTGRQTLHFFGAMSKVDHRTTVRRANELLSTVGMSDWADRKVGEYSKGMMQRIGLAQALINDPDLVLLDEPTDGVDPVGRREIREVIARLREQGKTVFINSHALSELESICDRVAILVHGQVARQGTIDELTVARQRYEIEIATPHPAALRSQVLAIFPAQWREATTAGFTAAPQPVGPPSSAAATQSSSATLPLDAAQRAAGMAGPIGRPAVRVIDRGTLANGVWVELDGPVLRVGTTDPAEMQPILDAFRAAGHTIRRLQPMRVSLEDLFMEAVIDPTTGAPRAVGARQGAAAQHAAGPVVPTGQSGPGASA